MTDRHWEASWHAWPLAFYARQSGARQTQLSVEVISYLTVGSVPKQTFISSSFPSIVLIMMSAQLSVDTGNSEYRSRRARSLRGFQPMLFPLNVVHP
jgi:hypothetical protein